MDLKEDIINMKTQTLSYTSKYNFEASNVEACRICLATDVKMYKLRETHLSRCMELVIGFDKSHEGLPNYVCYECAACLTKCSKLIEKSRTAQAALQNIFDKNGQITKTLIEEENRSELNLQSPLDSYVLINYFHIVSNSDLNTSNCSKAETDLEQQLDQLLKNEIKEDLSHEDSDMSEDLNADNMKVTIEGIKTDAVCSDDDVQEIKADIPVIEVSDDCSNENDFISLKPYAVKMDGRANDLIAHKYDKPIYDIPKSRGINKLRASRGKAKRGRGKIKRMMRNMNMSISEETPEETYMQKYFHVDVIPVQKTVNRKYSCKFCLKSFNNINQAKDHRVIGCSMSQSGNTANLAISFTEPGHHLTGSNQPLFWEDWDGDRI